MALPIDNSDFFSAYNSLSATAAPVDYGDTVDTDSMLQNFAAVDGGAVDEPLFTLAKVEYRPDGLRDMKVSEGKIVISLKQSVIRLDLAHPELLTDIELPARPDDRIHKTFLDPLGCHCIISTATAENWYLSNKLLKPRFLKGLKGVLIESVAWDLENTSTENTQQILIGTSSGIIIETMLDSKAERYVKHVYNMNDNTPVTGLFFSRFPPSANEDNKFFIMATTSNRIYQFIGGPSFENVFENYQINPGFRELPGNMNYSSLQYWTKRVSSGGTSSGTGKGVVSRPRSFAWMTGAGIFHGELVFGSQCNPGDSVWTDTTLLPYPTPIDPNDPTTMPLSLVVSEFHYILLYENKLEVISKLSEEVVHTETFLRSMRAKIGQLRGMTRDYGQEKIWVYAEYAVYELEVVNEDANVWQLYLDKEQYEQALQLCKTAVQKDKVWTAQADHYFRSGNLKLAATFYGKSHKSFEEITLRFIRMEEKDALKTYLLAKLENCGPRDATQKTMICSWLTEIFLDKLNHLSENLDLRNAYNLVQEEFKQFLEDHRASMDTKTTYNLIASHGRIDEMLFFSKLVDDHELVISHHLQRGDYHNALATLRKQTSEALFVKFSPSLMAHIPFETVNVWIRTPNIAPRKEDTFIVGSNHANLHDSQLIPALMRYNHDAIPPQANGQNQAIRYLLHCINALKNEDMAIHNYLLELYARERDENPLLHFLSMPSPFYDMEYALRLCVKEGKRRACVVIYSAMGLYEEAVELALSVDLELAKLNADKPDDDEDLKKKLWRRIARFVVEQERDIKKAMEFLNHCEYLKIEDILPFFPDFTLIDDFKEEICHSLEDYNCRIEELKSEMDEATKSADLIRADIKNLRNKYGFIGEAQKCDLCRYPVLTRQLYLFPCQHVFHADCLTKEMMGHLLPLQRQRVQNLQARIAAEGGPKSFAAGGDRDDSAAELESLKSQVDEIIAGECVHCGDIMINTIDTPFDLSGGGGENIESWVI